LGDRLEDLECLTLVIGPVSLATYNTFRTREKQRELDSVLALSAPCYQRRQVEWIVNYEDRSPRLGQEHENARLGINSRMGKRTKGDPAARGEAA
jgi:hypothetical protein